MRTRLLLALSAAALVLAGAGCAASSDSYVSPPGATLNTGDQNGQGMMEDSGGDAAVPSATDDAMMPETDGKNAVDDATGGDAMMPPASDDGMMEGSEGASQ